MPAVNHRALAHRLRELRKHHWSDVSLTQTELAEALGVSTASISSWEKPDGRALPRAEMLATYASFFATRRSVERRPFRVLNEVELDNDERTGRDELESELLFLRGVGRSSASVRTEPRSLSGPWRYPEGEDVVIICGEVPPEQRYPPVSPEHPTLAYGKFYSYADIDALFELHGHIRAANPFTQVEVRTVREMRKDDYKKHLVILGGVDFNHALRDYVAELDEMPVRQVSPHGDPLEAYYEVGGESTRQRFRVELGPEGKITTDIGHFFRAVNPFSERRTITSCNAMYSLGVLGVVRTLTDEKYREKNESYIAAKFHGSATYSILMKVVVIRDVALTPDWTVPDAILHEWPDDG